MYNHSSIVRRETLFQSGGLTQHPERVQLSSFMANVGAEDLKVSPSLLMYSGVCCSLLFVRSIIVLLVLRISGEICVHQFGKDML